MDRTLFRVLIAVLVPAGVLGYCPADLTQRIQTCTQGAKNAAASSTQNLTTVENFCKQGMEEAMKCVNTNINMCAQSQRQRDVLNMLINVDSMTSSLKNFCDNIHVLIEKKKCLRHLGSSSECVLDIVLRFESQVSKAPNAKYMMDLTCGFYDDVTDCYTSPFPQDCRELASMYESLLQANKFPYCSYSQEEKRVAIDKLEEVRMTGFITSEGVNGGPPSLSQSSVPLVVLLLASLLALLV